MKREGTVALALMLACGDSGGGAESEAEAEAESESESESESEGEPFEIVVIEDAEISGVGDAANFQQVCADIDLPAMPLCARVTVRYDLDSPCPDPPAFSDECDPWDRLTQVTLEGEPRVELLRGITPFGGDRTYEQDVSDLLDLLFGPRTICVFISTYADPTGMAAGTDAKWRVTLTLMYDPAPRCGASIAVPALFGRIDPATPVLAATVEIPWPLPVLRIYTTGHGADEFDRVENAVTIDGDQRWAEEPWRTDCELFCNDADSDGYCDENPWGLPASVRASRAGWCPGDIVRPILIDATDALVPGTHEIAASASDVAGYFPVSVVVVSYPAE